MVWALRASYVIGQAGINTTVGEKRGDRAKWLSRSGRAAASGGRICTKEGALGDKPSRGGRKAKFQARFGVDCASCERRRGAASARDATKALEYIRPNFITKARCLKEHPNYRHYRCRTNSLPAPTPLGFGSAF